MTTPLFKRLKNGTTVYVLPGAAEDLSASHQNEQVRMRFSKFALIRIPAQRAASVDPNAKAVLDFEDAFEQGGAGLVPATFGEALAESLRNYVANHECVVRGTRVSDTDYAYDTDAMLTVSERVFWKWLRKTGALSLEPALPNEQWTPADPSFDPSLPTDGTYMREYLWRERGVSAYLVQSVIRDGDYAKIRFERTTNFRPGDHIFLKDMVNVDVAVAYKVEEIETGPPDGGGNESPNDTVLISWDSGDDLPEDASGKTGYAVLDYEPVVQYIGEIGAMNNASGPTASYTEVFAFVPAQAGKTHTVLFKTVADENYRPGMEFPVLPEQFQPEISGAESPLSPIALNPANYPGDMLGHFDTDDYTYAASTGDLARRIGDYYGINPTEVLTREDIPYELDPSRPMTWPQFDPANIDGISLDLDIAHYPQAAAANAASFAEFSQSALNDRAPEDFEFNAILYFYDLEDVSGQGKGTVTNLYGIQVLDNPDRPEADPPNGALVPVTRKQVANGTQDGTSFTYSLNLTFQVDSENSPMAFDPDRVYSLFGFELYSEAMGRLAVLTDIYYQTMSQVTAQRQEVADLRGLVYTTQDLESFRARIDNLERLLTLYSTAQIGASDSMVPELDTSVNPPLIRMRSVDRRYAQIISASVRDMYKALDQVGDPAYAAQPSNISFSGGKDFMVVVTNDDDDTNNYPATADKLQLVIEKDLFYRQTVEFLILPKPDKARGDKRLEVSINFNDSTATENKVLFGPLPLPATNTKTGSNGGTSEVTGHYRAGSRFTPYAVYYNNGADHRTVVLDFHGDLTGLTKNGRVRLNDFVVKVGADVLDLSGQYVVDNQTDYPGFLPSPIADVQLVSNSAANGTPSAAYVMPVESPITTALGLSSSSADASIGFTVAAAGDKKVTGVYLLQGGNGYTPGDASLEVDLEGASLTWSGTTSALLVPQVRTRVHITMEVPELTSAMFVNPGVPSGVMLPLTPYMETTPFVDFNRGYRVLVTRISERPDVLASRLQDRYRVDVINL